MNFLCSLGEQENVAITLDDAYGTFISNDHVVISLKGGEMYVKHKCRRLFMLKAPIPNRFNLLVFFCIVFSPAVSVCTVTI